MWEFRLRFHAPPGRNILGAKEGLVFHIDGIENPLRIEHLPPKPNQTLSSPEIYLVTGRHFQNEAIARECGEKLKYALAIYGAKARIGIDLGHDEVTTPTSEELKESYRKQGLRLRDEVHGIDVYREDELPIRTLHVSGTLTTSHNIENFPTSVADEYQKFIPLTPKKQLALEIYNLVQFEERSKTKFLNLISVIEIICDRDKQPEDVKSHVDFLINQVKFSELSEENKEALTNGLGNLKRVSISTACRRLVEECINDEEARYFALCYNARSKLLHEGKIPEHEVLNLTRLEIIVQTVLLMSISGKCKNN